jgi:hypothetical protein
LDELVASLPLDQQHEVAETVYQFCKRNDKAQELVQWELKKEIEHTGTRRKRILYFMYCQSFYGNLSLLDIQVVVEILATL